VFQFFNLLPNLTVLENVALPLAIAGVRVAEQAAPVEKLLARFGLAHKHQAFPHQLSGGEMQRVSIARALAGGQPLLLCDEPTGNLSQKAGLEVMQLLRETVEQDHRSVLLVTHNPPRRHVRGSHPVPGGREPAGRAGPARARDLRGARASGPFGPLHLMGVGLLLARRNLTRKFARTLFSILGIAVGIATVVGVFTLDHNTIVGRSKLADSSWQAEIEVSPSAAVKDPSAELARVPGVTAFAAAFQTDVVIHAAAKRFSRARQAGGHRARARRRHRLLRPAVGGGPAAAERGVPGAPGGRAGPQPGRARRRPAVPFAAAHRTGQGLRRGGVARQGGARERRGAARAARIRGPGRARP
jgi:hypothetical protein